jgi:hypothetical protein
VQGFLFAKPMRVEACDIFLRQSYSSSARSRKPSSFSAPA